MTDQMWAGKSILIVDDMPKVIERLQSIYEQMGLDVIGSALNGVEALDQIRNLKPDLVSLDIIMPEMDGIECYRKIRDSHELNGFRPKAFFVSYLATEPKILESYRAEIPEHLFVAKTYTIEPLRSCLEKLYGLMHSTAETDPTAQSAEDSQGRTL